MEKNGQVLAREPLTAQSIRLKQARYVHPKILSCCVLYLSYQCQRFPRLECGLLKTRSPGWNMVNTHRTRFLYRFSSGWVLSLKTAVSFCTTLPVLLSKVQALGTAYYLWLLKKHGPMVRRQPSLRGAVVRATLLFGSQRAVSVCLRYPIPVGHCQ